MKIISDALYSTLNKDLDDMRGKLESIKYLTEAFKKVDNCYVITYNKILKGILDE